MSDCTFNDFNIGMTVYNINVNDGQKPLKVLGIRQTSFSGIS